MGNDTTLIKPETTDLRRRAEEKLKTAAPNELASQSEFDTHRLLHELLVNQIELEMQNEELRGARNEVEASLDKFTDLYDFAPISYVTLNRDGTVLAANLTATGLLEIDRSLLLGRRFCLFVTPENRQHFIEFLGKVFLNRCKNSCEVIISTEGQSRLTVQIEAIALGTGDECRIAIVDLTEHKRVEAEIHQTRERLAWVLDKASIGMWINELPLARLNWDTQIKRLFFCGPEVDPTIDLYWSRVHPDDREHTRLAIETSIREHNLYDIDLRLVNPATGEIRWIHSTGQARYATDGTPIHFDGISYDITERKLAEEQLRSSHDHCEQVVITRTMDLHKAIMQLSQEIDIRKGAEESLQGALEEIKQLKDRLEAENVYLQQEAAQNHNFGEIIGNSQSLSAVFVRIKQVAPMNATVLLLGETGTGKGVVARAIHSRSTRKGRPLITVDCTTLPAALAESELFGRERGAFTGSDSKQIGRFELADGGTVFLDEIGEMPLELQSKLLRIIQDGEFERLGSPRTIKTDVRIIAATNRDLEEEIRNGRFREDLFYRLNVFPILVPPLRQRKDDIPLLVNHFVAKYNTKIGKRIESVSKETLNTLQEYHWPGNVRELESVIERAVIVSQGKALQVLDRFDMFRKTEGPADKGDKALVDLERDHILQVLQKTGWRVDGNKGAALILGLNTSTLRARMRKYGITRQ